jgi:hypothetical protein
VLRGYPLFREARRSGRSSGSEGDRVLRALGYNRGRGHRSASTKLLIRARDRNMFDFVAAAVRLRRSTLDNAYNLAAADFCVSRETVIDGVKRYLHRLKDWKAFRKVPSTMEEYVELRDEIRKGAE